MALDFTLLTEEQIWGDDDGNGQLDVIKKYGTRVVPTDLALLLKAPTSKMFKGPEKDGWSTDTWTASPSGFTGNVAIVHPHGSKGASASADDRCISVRPVLPPSETAKIQPTARKKGVYGVDIVEYGEYPQTVADETTARELEELFRESSPLITGKWYTFDSATDSHSQYTPECYSEYEYNNKKYIRIIGRPFDFDTRLSNDETAREGKAYWVEVQPIEWLADPTGTWVAKKALLSGIQFDGKGSYDGDFSNTFMKYYLQSSFAENIEPSEMTEEHEKRIKREEAIEGLKAKLAEAIDPEKVKAKVGFTRTESRREIAKAIKTTRRARDVFIAAGKQAQKEGDQELIDQIVEMADFYVRSDQAQRSAAHQRHAESRAQRAAAKKDGGR